MSNDSIAYNGPFHQGELVVQSLFDKSEEADYLGRRMFQPVISNTTYPFVQSVSFVVISFVNVSTSQHSLASSWSTILFGSSGFLSLSNNGKAVSVHNAAVPNYAEDPLKDNLESGLVVPISLIVVSFEERRRYRINGYVKPSSIVINGSISFVLNIVGAFGNCPKYIQARTFVSDGRDLSSTASDVPKLPSLVKPSNVTVEESSRLTPQHCSLIKSSDTLFVASYSNAPSSRKSLSAFESDISHRGGQPGFIRIVSDAVICWPEYQGNNMFMTLGNIHSNPKTGLLILDFAHRKVLQLSGNAKLVKVDPSDPNALVMDGSNRYVEFTITEAILQHNLPRTEFIESSPYNPPLSGFMGQETHSAAAQSTPTTSELILNEVVQLSANVAAFRFSVIAPLRLKSCFCAGQFASINIILPGASEVLNRSWTITDIAVDENDSNSVNQLELTIKRSANNGLVSNWLHDTFRAKEQREVRDSWSNLMRQGKLKFELAGISGNFSIFINRFDKSKKKSSVFAKSVDECKGKILFLSGGIGVTPFVSTIKSIFSNKDALLKSLDSFALDIILIASFRTEEEARGVTSFLDSIEFNDARVRLQVHVMVTSNSEEVRVLESSNAKIVWHVGSRISTEAIQQIVGDVSGRDVYLCGPDIFMLLLTDSLTNQLSVSESHIHTEEFTF